MRHSLVLSMLCLTSFTCGRTGPDDLDPFPGPTPSEPAAQPMMPVPPTASPMVLAEVMRGFTALTRDDDFIYFAGAGSRADVDRVARVPRLGGQVVELASRPGSWGAKRSIARVGEWLLVASQTAFFLVSTTGGAVRMLQPPPVTAVGQGVGHLLHSNGQLAAWLAADGVLYVARPTGNSVDIVALVTPEGPLDRRTTGAVFVGADAVFFAASWPDPTGVWEGHVSRFGLDGRLERRWVTRGPGGAPLLTADGRQLAIAFGNQLDLLSPRTLELEGSVRLPELVNLALDPRGGWVQLQRTSPDAFGGKLDALTAVVRVGAGAQDVMSHAGHSDLGGALLVEPGAVLWVRRKGTVPGGDAVLERVPLP